MQKLEVENTHFCENYKRN